MREKLILISLVLPVSLGLGIFVYNTFYLQNTPESLLKEYYSCISKKDYERMYDLLCQQSREDNPLYNKFRQIWCPGSTFKPVTGAIALEEGSIDPDQEYDSEGFRWRKDASWGSYYIKTLHEYHPVNLRNALIFSDNFFFAKTALGIGSEALEEHLLRLGFRKQIPFPIIMKPSEFSGKDHISSEIQLADSGYGLSQMGENTSVNLQSLTQDSRGSRERNAQDSLLSDGVSQKDFERLMTRYLPVSRDQIREYAAYDDKTKTYPWEERYCMNYSPTSFGTSLPEVVDVRENPDRTLTLTIDAVCDHVICDDHLITSELTVRINDKQEIRYLANHVISGKENIPEYQYRIRIYE